MKCVSLFVSLLSLECSGFTYQEQVDSGTVPWYAQYCNKDATQYTLPDLTEKDASLVSELIQVQAFTRHGARVTTGPISKYFPIQQSDPSTAIAFDCKYSTITTRVDGSSDSDVSPQTYLSLRKKYVSDTETVPNNCLAGQSVSDLYDQQTANGKIFRNRYLSGDSTVDGWHKSSVLSSNEMSSLVDCMFDSSCEDWKSSLLFRSSDVERTLASATAFITAMLAGYVNEDPSRYVTDLALELSLNDITADPYNPTKDYYCTALGSWVSTVNKRSTQYQSVIDSDFYKSSAQAWDDETGSSLEGKGAIGTLPVYCANLNLNMTEETFDNGMNVSYQLKQAIFGNPETSHYTLQVGSGLMGNLMLELLPSLEWDPDSSDSANSFESFIYHSFHDTSIFYFLGALGVSDGIQPSFAEHLSLEVYSAPSFSSGKAFRFLRAGKTLPFNQKSNCISNGVSSDELCDLQQLFDILMEFAMPKDEWEPYCVNVTTVGTNNSTE